MSLASLGDTPFLAPRANTSCAGVRLLPPAEPVTRKIFTVSRRGGDRQPAVRVVLDAHSEAARAYA